MAATTCQTKDCLMKPCVFVLRWKHDRVLSKRIAYFERSSCHVHAVSNGFIVICDSESLFKLCVKVLQRERIFHQKWVCHNC